MKKLLLSVALVAASFGASAASDNKSFDVKVNLVSVCKLSSISTVDFGDYTSMTGLAGPVTGGAFTATCTNTTVYGLHFGSITGLTTAGGTFPNTNLNYTLSLNSPGGAGTGGAVNHNVIGAMAASQVGTCATTTCSETIANAHTLYVVY